MQTTTNCHIQPLEHLRDGNECLQLAGNVLLMLPLRMSDTSPGRQRDSLVDYIQRDSGIINVLHADIIFRLWRRFILKLHIM